jgi:hypothetical protein
LDRSVLERELIPVVVPAFIRWWWDILLFAVVLRWVEAPAAGCSGAVCAIAMGAAPISVPTRTADKASVTFMRISSCHTGSEINPT